ncbi:hypothetical protein GQ600_27502 [Phytophthora cactorum]|nr:hypothetical protein GQ600_27502 [Phytophthora cactorum]
MKSYVIPLIDPAFKFTIKYSSAWLQSDGYNCGVFVVKWSETYLKVAVNTTPKEDLRTLTPQQMTTTDIDDCRYRMFEIVCLDICKN